VHGVQRAFLLEGTVYFSIIHLEDLAYPIKHSKYSKMSLLDLFKMLEFYQ
jgi:hypothetical protein